MIQCAPGVCLAAARHADADLFGLVCRYVANIGIPLFVLGAAVGIVESVRQKRLKGRDVLPELSEPARDAGPGRDGSD